MIAVLTLKLSNGSASVSDTPTQALVVQHINVSVFVSEMQGYIERE